MLQAEHKIKVVCRVRPFLEAEQPDDSVSVEPNNVLRVTNPRDASKDVEFNFDACYGPGETQEAIYQNDVEPLVDTIFTGMSATVFCYGVTGAGKTHTIQGTEKDPGIIPRALRHIFGRQHHDPLDYDIRISYYEIYKEAVYDLLKPQEPPIALPIREDAHRKVFVAGLSERKITSLEQFNTIYQRACRNRRIASTKLNNHSSRSHAILTVRVQWTDKEKAWCGRVHLIDLAGSEDNRRTANNKDRLAESSAINRSLFVLGQVVEALNSSSLRIPYRDSKMTRILQDSLGGESMGMMIVNVAPGEGFLQETHNTLSFATKSRKVVNKPVAHEVIEPRWTVVDRLQHHRGLGRPVRPGMVVAAASGAKRRWSDEIDALESDRSPSIEGSSTSRERIASRRRISPAVGKQSARHAPAIEVSDKPLPQQGNFAGRTVSKTLHDVEQRTEAASQEIMERVIRIEKQLQKPTLDSDQVMDLFTPATKLKTSRGWLKYARDLEHNGELEKALVHYEEALRYAPELNKLDAHIAKLKAKIRRERRRSSIASHGSANMRIADRKSADLEMLGKGDNRDSDDDEDVGPLWLVDGLAESPGAEKARRQRTAQVSEQPKKPLLIPRSLVFGRLPQSNETTPAGSASAMSYTKTDRSQPKRVRLETKPSSFPIRCGQSSQGLFASGKSSSRSGIDSRLKHRVALASSKEPYTKGSRTAKPHRATQEPPTPDDRNDQDFVPSSDASDAEEIEEAKLLCEMTMYGSASKSRRKGHATSSHNTLGSLSRQQKAGDDSGQCNSPADAAADLSVDKNLNLGSKRKPSSVTNAEEDPLALDSFNSICIASAMQIINSGDIKKIMKLQGIGKRRAEQIQASVLAEGPVVNIADLKDRLHFKNKIIVGILSTFA